MQRLHLSRDKLCRNIGHGARAAVRLPQPRHRRRHPRNRYGRLHARPAVSGKTSASRARSPLALRFFCVSYVPVYIEGVNAGRVFEFLTAHLKNFHIDHTDLLHNIRQHKRLACPIFKLAFNSLRCLRAIYMHVENPTFPLLRQMLHIFRRLRQISERDHIADQKASGKSFRPNSKYYILPVGIPYTHSFP